MEETDEADHEQVDRQGQQVEDEQGEHEVSEEIMVLVLLVLHEDEVQMIYLELMVEQVEQGEHEVEVEQQEEHEQQESQLLQQQLYFEFIIIQHSLLR